MGGVHAQSDGGKVTSARGHILLFPPLLTDGRDRQSSRRALDEGLGGLPGGQESTEEQGQGKEEGSGVSPGEEEEPTGEGTGFFIWRVGGGRPPGRGRWAIFEDEVGAAESLSWLICKSGPTCLPSSED